MKYRYHPAFGEVDETHLKFLQVLKFAEKNEESWKDLRAWKVRAIPTFSHDVVGIEVVVGMGVVAGEAGRNGRSSSSLREIDHL
jgi:hypothetical protein